MRVFTAAWRVMAHPGWAFLLAVLSVGLVTAAWFLPQLPGQLQSEPVASMRWLGDRAGEYGRWGNVLLVLGFFNVVRSPLFFIVLTAMAGKLGIWLADEIAAWRQLRAAKDTMRSEFADGDSPLPLPAPPVIVREGVLLPESPPDENLLRESLAKLYSTVSVRHGGGAERGSTQVRILGLRNERTSFLRVLGPGGLLLALIGVWVAAMLGEQMTTPILAPGDTYRAVEQGLTIHYLPPLPSAGGENRKTGDGTSEHADAAAGAGQGDRADLAVIVSSTAGDSETLSISLESSSSVTVLSDGTRVGVRSEGIALWISGQSPFLARPGSDRRLSQIGLVLNDRGGEESILLPGFSAGLRIVARPANEGLPILVELYRSGQEEPVLRREVQVGVNETFSIDGTTMFSVVAMPGVRVESQQIPGLLLVWGGFGLVLASSLAYIRSPGFAVVQTQPWSPTATLVTVQSNQRASVADITLSIITADAGTPR